LGLWEDAKVQAVCPQEVVIGEKAATLARLQLGFSTFLQVSDLILEAISSILYPKWWLAFPRQKEKKVLLFFS
jgi:hypothetical protein